MSTPNTPENNQEKVEKQTKKPEDIKSELNQKLQNYIKNNYTDNKENRKILQSVVNRSDDAIKIFKRDLKKYLQENFAKEIIEGGDRTLLDELVDKAEFWIWAREALSNRKQSENSVIQKTKMWFDTGLDSQKRKKLEILVSELTNKEIKESITSSEKLKKILQTTNQTHQIFENNELNRIFQPKNVHNFINELCGLTNNTDAQNIFRSESFEEAIKIFLKSGNFDGEEFKKIVVLNNISLDEKKKIIAKFFPTLTYEEVKKYKLFDDSFLANEEKKILDEISLDLTGKKFNELSEDTQNDIQLYLQKYQNTKEYSTLDIDASILQNALEDMSEEGLFKNLHKNFEEQGKAYIDHIEEQKNAIKTLDEMKNFLIENLTSEEKNRIGWNTGINQISEGKFIKQEISGTTQKGFWKITNDTNDGGKWIRIQEYKIQSNGVGNFEWKSEPNHYAFTYTEFAHNIMERLSNPNAHISLTDNTEVINSDEILNLMTLEDLTKAIDNIDEDNKEKWFEVGTTLSVKFDHNGKKRREMVTISAIDEYTRQLEITLFDGQRIEATFADFINIIEEENMTPRRIGKTGTLEDFAKNAGTVEKDAVKSINGIAIKNDKLVQINPLDNTKIDDIWWFQGNKNFLKVTPLWNGRYDVTLTEYKTNQEWEEIAKEQLPETDRENFKEKYSEDQIKKLEKKNAKKAKILKEEAKRFSKNAKKYSNVSHTMLLQMMQDTNATKPSIKQDIVRGDGKTVAMDPLEAFEEQVKVENGFYMEDQKTSPIRWTSIGEISYGVKHIVDFYKKKFEHKSEVKSAYAFMRLNKFTGAGGVSNMAKLINGTKDDLKDRFKWKEMRAYIAKNILSGNPKPHEILAGLMITIEMAGHLYPDTSLMDYQDNTYRWFNKVCHAINVEPKAAFKQCFSKVVGNDDEIRHHPPEEKLIERLFKLNQDNPMVQAIGGGAPFWKAADGTKAEQTNKWKAEASEIPNFGDRLQYAVSKMESNEFEIVVGAIPEIFNKDAEHKAFGPFFIIAASNATNYVSPKTLDDFQKMRFTIGSSFHATGFCKNRANSEIYRNAVAIALRNKFGPESAISKEFNRIQKEVESAQYHHKEDIYKDLGKFWSKYHSDLQPIMQLTDPTLFIALENPETPSAEKNYISKYISIFGESGGYYQGSAGIRQFKDFNTSALNTFSAHNNHVFLQKSQWGEQIPYRSISLQLDALEIDSHRKSMSGASRATVFQNQIIDYFKEVRDNPTFRNNPEYQRKQFTIIYAELMNKLTEKTFPIEEEYYNVGKNTDTLKHFSMLENQLGFDCSYEHMMIKNRIKWYKYEQDVTDEFFDKFLNSGWNKLGIKNTAIRTKISEQVSHLTFTAGANDENYRQAA